MHSFRELSRNEYPNLLFENESIKVSLIYALILELFSFKFQFYIAIRIKERKLRFFSHSIINFFFQFRGDKYLKVRFENESINIVHDKVSSY